MRRTASAGQDAVPSITTFRSRVRCLLEREAASGHRRHIVILALDGIPYDLAATTWSKAKVTRMQSIFPTTSSTAWLSSLTGTDVAHHGVPGVVFRLPDRYGDLVNVFSHRGPLNCPSTGNIFRDAIELGYRPLTVLGDLEPFECSWRDVLLQDSERVEGYRFYTASEPFSPSALGHVLRDAISECLTTRSLEPRLVWCFVDCDQRIHYEGYDSKLVRFLECTESIAGELVERDTVVVAHSDHGLAPTCHDEGIASLIQQTEVGHGCSMGGAGRTRWLYTRPGVRDEIVDELRRDLPASVRVCLADHYFPTKSLARSRVGEILLIAEDERFITSSGYRFDHGTLTSAETIVPFAEWHA
jgi:hypothetical protein